MEKNIIRNAIRTPDGTVLVSKHQHDFVTYTDSVSNEEYLVDGGTVYLRRSKNEVPFEDLTIYSDAEHVVIREYLEWGTYGKNGDQPLRFKALKDLDTEHIEAIIETQKRLPSWKVDIFREELVYRGENHSD
ncbi:hypothetical protein [Vibrio mediterranei]|uniref:hypothetical protein n=1 Tax=Vibrio mediterranei TaxID=689 RepID=UPI0040681CC0